MVGKSNKLRRTKFQKLDDNPDSMLFVEDPRIQIKKASKLSPSLRQFKVDSSIDVVETFKRYGIVDAHQQDLAPSYYDLSHITNHLICGDSRYALSRIPSDSIACIVTSPPYWNTVDYGVEGQYGQCSFEDYLAQLVIIWKECARILRPNGKLCINTPIIPIPKSLEDSQHTRHLKNLNNDIESSILESIPDLHRYSLYIWKKQTTEKMFGSYPYPPNIFEQNTVEFINVLVKDGAPIKLSKGVKEESKINETEWMNLTKQIWDIYPEDVKRYNHPAPFPRAIPNRLIAMYTFKRVSKENDSYIGDIILDPFCGIGATCIAAKELGRNYIGIDIVPDFCIEAARRIETWPSGGSIFLLKNNEKEPPESTIKKLL